VVRVPHAHRPGSIGSSALQRIFILRADDRLAVESIQVVDADRLLEELEAGLSVDPNKRALLYIHGYNTTFQGAAVRAAQIGFDLGIRGIMAFFSWPSHGTIRHYLADGTAIELAEDSFVQYVQLLMRVEGIQHIDILAHSMGNRLLLRTIAILSQLKATAERPVRIRHILLAAPDVDIGKFGQVVEHYRSVLDRWTTVYTCRKDLAIAASTWLSDAKRLGYEPPVYSDFGLDTISASLLPLDWLGHGYFAAAQPLLADMTAILDHDSRPESRKLLAVGGHPPTYWRLR
jgi:esterase/lipase superfamily enzyme